MNFFRSYLKKLDTILAYRINIIVYVPSSSLMDILCLQCIWHIYRHSLVTKNGVKKVSSHTFFSCFVGRLKFLQLIFFCFFYNIFWSWFKALHAHKQTGVTYIYMNGNLTVIILLSNSKFSVLMTYSIIFMISMRHKSGNLREKIEKSRISNLNEEKCSHQLNYLILSSA